MPIQNLTKRTPLDDAVMRVQDFMNAVSHDHTVIEVNDMTLSLQDLATVVAISILSLREHPQP